MTNSIPQGWNRSNVNNTCDVLDSKRIPVNSEERANRKGPYPYYGANGIQGFIDEFIFEGEHILLAEDGGNFDLWESRPISYLVSGKFWVNNHAHILKAKSGHSTRFIHYSLVHKNITKHINGGTRAKLNQSDMRDIELALPPLPEQQKIDAILTSVDKGIEFTQAQINKLKDLKTGMMHELLTNGIEHSEFRDSPVGRIPKAWDCELLDKVAKRGSGHTPDKQKKEYWNGGIKWISLADSSKLDKLHIGETEHEISIEGIKNSSAVLHPKGTVVLSRDAGIGKSAVTTDAMAVSQHFMAWTCGEKLDKYFLYYLLQMWKPRFENIAIGSTIKTIGLAYFKTLEIPLPKIGEQIKIAEILLGLDDSIFKSERKRNQLTNIKKALMQDLLTGKVRVKVS
jgi:type I restriction enzyme S subunit